MERILRVRNWEKNFETSETRKWKHLKWIPVPNNQSDPGYCKLLTRANGPQMFGAWIGLIQTASRCKKRGTFVEGDGTPYDIESLAAVVRMPAELIAETVELLTTEIKWLEWVTPNHSAVAEDSPATTSLNRTERNGTESNGTEQNFDHVKDSSVPSPSDSANSGECARDIRKIASVVRPRTRQDRELIAKVCLLKQVGPLSQNAVWDAMEAVRVKGAKVDKPVAYFQRCLSEHARKERHDLGALLRGVRAPPELLAVFDEKPDPRLCSV